MCGPAYPSVPDHPAGCGVLPLLLRHVPLPVSSLLSRHVVVPAWLFEAYARIYLFSVRFSP